MLPAAYGRRRHQERELRPVGGPFEGGSHAYVIPVEHGGEPAVLKVIHRDGENAAEPTALRDYDGDGAVRLYEYEPDTGAMLLREVTAIGPDETADELLQRLYDETHEKLAAPVMLTGPVEGRFLEMLVWASRARRVLEIGTYSGYSALSMAAALRAAVGRVEKQAPVFGVAPLEAQLGLFLAQRHFPLLGELPALDPHLVGLGPEEQLQRLIDELGEGLAGEDLLTMELPVVLFPDEDLDLLPALLPGVRRRGRVIAVSGRVLIVDDDEDTRALLSRIVRQESFEPLEAPDGETALGAVAREAPDVVFLDMRLPGAHGMEILRRLKAIDATLPVIMITAHNSPELTLGAAALGAYRVISKPFEVENLAAIVNQARQDAG